MPTFEDYWAMHVGLRGGTEAKNAAYAMTDLDDTGRTPLRIMMWVADEARDPDLTTIWANRIENSLCKTAGLSGDTMPILIVNQARIGGERYRTTGAPCSVGDALTFLKTHLLPPDAQILAKRTFDATPAGVILATSWVRAFLGR